MKYVVVVPAKDEEANIRDTLESVANQTIPPRLVLVIDDNSTDRTFEIVQEMEQRYPFISHYRTATEQAYIVGGHIVRLLKTGKRLIDEKGIDYDWIVKLDADVEFEPDFMERIYERVHGQKLGIVSGTPYLEEGGTKILDTSPRWHTHGQFKIYNAECYREFGGPIENVGWDGADNVAAISAGWQCIAYPDIHYLMRRRVGGKATNRRGRINHGISSYQSGYNPAYFLLRVLHDVFKRPYLLGAVHLLIGYFQAAINRYPKILTREQRRLMRKLMWSSIGDRLRNRDFVLLQKLMPRKSP